MTVLDNQQSQVCNIDIDSSANPLVSMDNYPVLCTGLKERITAVMFTAKSRRIKLPPCQLEQLRQKSRQDKIISF